MKFLVPLLCDSSREPVGLFSATTSAGELVILFSNQARWTEFADAVAPFLRKQNQFLGSITLDANSLNDAVEQLADIHEGVLDEATFLPDSAPIVEDVIAYFAAQSVDA